MRRLVLILTLLAFGPAQGLALGCPMGEHAPEDEPSGVAPAHAHHASHAHAPSPPADEPSSHSDRSSEHGGMDSCLTVMSCGSVIPPSPDGHPALPPTGGEGDHAIAPLCDGVPRTDDPPPPRSV